MADPGTDTELQHAAARVDGWPAALLESARRPGVYMILTASEKIYFSRAEPDPNAPGWVRLHLHYTPETVGDLFGLAVLDVRLCDIRAVGVGNE